MFSRTALINGRERRRSEDGVTCSSQNPAGLKNQELRLQDAGFTKKSASFRFSFKLNAEGQSEDVRVNP